MMFMVSSFLNASTTSLKVVTSAIGVVNTLFAFLEMDVSVKSAMVIVPEKGAEKEVRGGLQSSFFCPPLSTK